MSGTMGGVMGYQSAKAQQKVAYANADTLEAQSRANLIQAGREMQDVSAQGEQEMSKARAAQGGSGLTSGGSGSTREMRVASALAAQLETSSENAAVQDINTRYQATMSRWEGDMAKQQGKASLVAGIASDAIAAAMSVAAGAIGAGAAGSTASTAGTASATAASTTTTAAAASTTTAAASTSGFGAMSASEIGFSAMQGLFRTNYK
ncbi:MAG: hypothetical protein R3Y56_07535 [Akkermansia sp.]